ncbi:MAG TPA: ABC transporter ATP-binding protein [Burkholderiales bacterium]
MTEPLLQTHELSRRFGGLMAVGGVSLGVAIGEVHAVIGPNGAGKSTFINMLSGDLAPSAGRIVFEGREISGLAPERISRLGIGRSYQKTNVFPTFTVLENCRLAAQSRLPSSMRFFKAADKYEAVIASARDALSKVGLQSRERAVVSELSHGERRQVEIAMALATRPRVLLLDEPLAGMGAEESQRITALLQVLAADHAIVLVEHDMDAVFALAHTLTVMVNGKVLESGPPAQIRASRAVQEAYLGVENV